MFPAYFTHEGGGSDREDTRGFKIENLLQLSSDITYFPHTSPM